MSRIFGMEVDTTVIFYDNQSCLKMTENTMFHDKLKHIEIRYFYIRDMVQKGAIKLQYVTIDEQVFRCIEQASILSEVQILP